MGQKPKKKTELNLQTREQVSVCSKSFRTEHTFFKEFI
jgi:hypothetical protein